MSQDDVEAEVDVEALLASINANFEQPIIDDQNQDIVQVNQNILSQVPEKQINDYQSQADSVLVLRSEQEYQEKEFDPIIDILNRFDIQNSLLTEKTIQEQQLDTTSIQQIVGAVKDKFDFQQEILYRNQTIIIQKINDIRGLSQILLQKQTIKEYTFSKVKTSEVNQKIKDLQSLDLQLFKTKGYVLTMIERLEIIEGQLDRIMDFHVKSKMEQMEQKAKHQTNELKHQQE